ncbi:hypothetical protein DMP23_09660 [Amycolatopsis sp. A1MSW2902]
MRRPSGCSDDIRELVPDWRTHLRAKNGADSAIDAYLDSVPMRVNCLDDEDIAMVAPEIGRRELDWYFGHLRQPPNCRTGDVGEIVWLSPFREMVVPHVPDNPLAGRGFLN